MDILNILFAVLSIGLGCFGWLAPKYTMSALYLETGLNEHGQRDTLGLSELRASVGCLFVGMGVGALILGDPVAYAMLGFCWTGAAVGRLTSCVIDGASRKKWLYFWIEAVVGVPAIVLNL